MPWAARGDFTLMNSGLKISTQDVMPRIEQIAAKISSWFFRYADECHEPFSYELFIDRICEVLADTVSSKKICTIENRINLALVQGLQIYERRKREEKIQP